MLRTTPLAALAAFASLAAPVASAQEVAAVVDNFEDGAFAENVFIFSGGENGVLSLVDDTPDGSSFAASFFANSDAIGGFTGFGQPIDGGPLDVTGVENPVVEFDLAATGTFTLEINLQNTGGGGEGEIRNALRFDGASGEYQRYRLSLGSFFTTNEASFEADDVFQYVWTILDASGGEVGFLLDNVQVTSGLTFESQTTAFDFDSGDFSSFFFFAGGEGIAASATTDTPDGSANAFSGLIDGDEFGGFAGFGSTIAGAPLDVSGAESLNFFLRTNGDATLEVNIQTDAAEGGNEIRERIRVADTDGEYAMYSIPLEAFIQSSANMANLASVFNLVFTFVDVPGDGNGNSTEFQFDLDAVAFGVQGMPSAAEGQPEAFAFAPSVYPNPTAASAIVSFALAAPSVVRADVVDLLGRRVLDIESGAQAAGPVQLAIPAGSLSAGTYLVRVQTETGVAVARLTVVR